MDVMNIDEEIFSFKCNIELRTSQLQRLLTTASSRQTMKSGTNQLDQSEPPKESIFSSNNYGVSTLSGPGMNPSKIDSAGGYTEKRTSIRSTGGPKVKTSKPYCTLI